MEEDKSKHNENPLESVDGYQFGIPGDNHPGDTNSGAALNSGFDGPLTSPEPPANSYVPANGAETDDIVPPVLPSRNLPMPISQPGADESSEFAGSRSAQQRANSDSLNPAGLSQVAPTPGAVNSPNSGSDKFAIDEVLTFAWQEMFKYFWPLTGVMTCNFLVQGVPTAASMIINYTSNSSALSLLGSLISLTGAILGIIISLGTINVWLKVVDGEKIAVRDVYTNIGKTWRYFCAGFVYGCMVVLGYICLVVPGIYLQLRFQFYGYFIVESDARPIDALKASYAITKGSVAELFFLGIINYFINWVGALLLLVGMVPAQIIQHIALAKTYRHLRANTPLSEMPPNIAPLPVITSSSVPIT